MLARNSARRRVDHGATLVDSALAGRASTALSLVTELNFPLKGTMTAASTTHKPITNHGTVIAFGAPTKAGTAAAHGSPLGAEEIKVAK